MPFFLKFNFVLLQCLGHGKCETYSYKKQRGTCTTTTPPLNVGSDKVILKHLHRVYLEHKKGNIAN